MSDRSNAPVIVKRRKVVAGDGHHGGAWKVAYADFVTAMMAFFLLMWLINVTTVEQRQGLAEYFSPTVPISRKSGGGDGAFGGDNVFTEKTLAQSGTGGYVNRPKDSTVRNEGGPSPEEAATFGRLRDELLGRGESDVSKRLKRHIITRVTDEGLIVEIFARPGAPLFRGETDTPSRLMQDLAALIARVFGLVRNDVAIGGHLAAFPIVRADNPAWELSTRRAQRTRAMLETDGLSPDRSRRVTGHADRKPVASDPLSVRNNRIELIVLRSDR